MNYAPILAALIFAAISFASGITLGHKWTERDVLKLKTEYAQQLAAATEDAKQREVSARAEERRTTLKVMEAADAANLENAASRARAQRLDRDAERLRDAYIAAAAASGAAEGAPTATGSSPATGAGLVLADLLGWAEPRLRSCATALDEARTAGLACERAYDAVSGLPANRTSKLDLTKSQP